MDIMSKVHATFPETRIVYVTSDEASMPASKDEIRRVCRSKFQMELQWKSDLLPAALIGRLTSLECSIIDFEIAKYCPRFIGLTRSTFSNMLGIEKFASTRSPVRGHYIYNSPGKLVVERKDNILTSAAQRAVLPAYVDTLLADGNAA